MPHSRCGEVDRCFIVLWAFDDRQEPVAFVFYCKGMLFSLTCKRKPN